MAVCEARFKWVRNGFPLAPAGYSRRRRLILTRKSEVFVRLARVIPIVDRVGYSRTRFGGEGETSQGFFTNAIIPETNQLPQKSELLEIPVTPGADDQVKM